MTATPRWTHLATLVLATIAAGCGSCQQTTEPPPKAPAARAPKAAVAPTGPVSAPAAALPTARELPTIGEAAGRSGEGEEQPPLRRHDEPGAAGEEYVEADCIVLADAEPDYGPPPLEVQFEADYECYDDAQSSITWHFGDGTTSSEANPAHTYTEVGEYVARVVLSTPDGARTEDEIDIDVEEYEEEFDE